MIMNVREKIGLLDDVVLKINGYTSYNIEQLHRNHNEYVSEIKGRAVDCLREIGANNEIIKRINSISFSRNPGYSLGANHRDYQQIIEADFRNGVNAIVRILSEYRNILERTKNGKIQLWTLICSAIAAIGGIISLFIAIVH